MAQRRFANRLEDEILYNRQLIAVVGHAAETRCLPQYILDFDEQRIWKMSLDNTSISRFRFNRAGWFPIAINATAHLRGASYTAAAAQAARQPVVAVNGKAAAVVGV